MKKISIKLLSLLVVSAMALTSCLNDLEDFIDDFSNVPGVAEFNEAPNAATGTLSREIIDPTEPAEFSLRVNITVVDYLSVPTKVTLALDNALVTEYNTERGLTGSAAATPVPASAIGFTSMEVTIPAGEREAEWEFTVDATKVPNPVSTFYLIGIKITAAENDMIISGNNGERLIRVLARNQWDGLYTVTGTMVDYANAALTGYHPHDIRLITTGGNTCSVYDETIGGYYYPILNGGSLSYYGSYGLNITFDAATSKVTAMSNYWGVVSNTRAAALDATGANTVGADKKITLKYFMLQPSVITAPPHVRCSMDEVWTYKGPRP